MTQIYLIRHAEAEGNLYRRVQGQYDSLVTGRGFRQIAALAERFRDVHVDAVYASDLYRTQKTISAIYLSHGLELHTDPGLREVAMGVWEDKPWGQIAREDKQQLIYFNGNSPLWHVEGGETFEVLGRRLRDTLTKLACRHDGQVIAVASHGMAIRNALAAIQGMTVEGGKDVPHCDNTGVSLLEYDGGRWRVVYLNDNSHLPAELSTFAGQKWWKAGSGFWEDRNLWYRPLDMDRDGTFYYQCRRDAWITIHKTLDNFDGDGFCRDARVQAKASDQAVWQVMLGEEPVGVIQLDIPTARREQYGPVPFLYLMPDYRGQGLGVQLIGQAVSVFRHMGCDTLRLRCAPDNEVAQRFYARYGFHKIGEAQGSRVPLDVLEKYIGFDDERLSAGL